MTALGDTPYQPGERVRPADLQVWSYMGLEGRRG